MLPTSVNYTATDRIRDIIEDNWKILFVLNRFKIPFGSGNRTVGNVCEKNNIDCPTFLAVINLINDRNYNGQTIHLPTLVDYLREAHSYILDFFLPAIRDTLIRGVHQPKSDNTAIHIIKFFDEYMDEVRNHMAFEGNTVFPYIDQLQKGVKHPGFHIKDFASKHTSMTSKLDELKDIFLQHYSIPNTPILSKALSDITLCGEDLISHCEIEDRLLIPAVERLERMNHAKIKADKDITHESASYISLYESLSEREKDIIKLVAHGLSNKEIACRLCLSFHTITTYRKNLSTKLNIHSSAALTIFAILHNIIDPKEIELK